jgi:hypothetical protein
MPVEILELIVRANVQEQTQSNTVLPAESNGNEENSFQKNVLLEECVEQVLEILRRREER